MIYEQSIGSYLNRTASDAPAPGGGAAASLQLAQAAALIAMSARFSTGEKFAEYAPMVERVLATAKPLIGESLEAGDDDAAAFAKVADAYGMPRDTEAAKEARTKEIQRALIGATEPPQRLLELGRKMAALGEELLECANRNILSDIVAATAATRAAATIAQATLEINLSGVKDDDARSTVSEHIRGADSLIDSCDNLTKRIREDLPA